MSKHPRFTLQDFSSLQQYHSAPFWIAHAQGRAYGYWSEQHPGGSDSLGGPQSSRVTMQTHHILIRITWISQLAYMSPAMSSSTKKRSRKEGGTYGEARQFPSDVHGADLSEYDTAPPLTQLLNKKISERVASSTSQKESPSQEQAPR